VTTHRTHRWLDAGADATSSTFDLVRWPPACARAAARDGRADPTIRVGDISLNPATHSVAARSAACSYPRRVRGAGGVTAAPGAPLAHASWQDWLYGWDRRSRATHESHHSLRRKLAAIDRTLRAWATSSPKNYLDPCPTADCLLTLVALSRAGWRAHLRRVLAEPRTLSILCDRCIVRAQQCRWAPRLEIPPQQGMPTRVQIWIVRQRVYLSRPVCAIIAPCSASRIWTAAIPGASTACRPWLGSSRFTPCACSRRWRGMQRCASPSPCCCCCRCGARPLDRQQQSRTLRRIAAEVQPRCATRWSYRRNPCHESRRLIDALNTCCCGCSGLQASALVADAPRAALGRHGRSPALNCSTVRR